MHFVDEFINSFISQEYEKYNMCMLSLDIRI